MSKYDDFDDFDDFGPERAPVNLKPYIELALKKWKTILLWAVIGAAFGIMIGFSTPKTFTSETVVAPELATRSTMSGGLNALSSLAGINMNSLAITDAMHPDLYPEVIRSVNMCISLFDLPVAVETKDSTVHTDLYDYIVNYNKAPWWAYVFGLPRKGIEWVKGWFTPEDELDDAEGYASIDTLRLTREQELVIASLRKSITAAVAKRSYVLSVKVTMQDRVIAAQVANAVIDRLQEFVVAYRTEKSRKDLNYFKTLYEQRHSEYVAAQRAYAYYADSHQGTSSRSSRIYEQQLQNEAQLHYQMFNQTAQNLIAAEAKVQQKAPVLVTIQQAFASRKGKPSKVKLAMLWFVLGAVFGAAMVILKNAGSLKENVAESNN